MKQPTNEAPIHPSCSRKRVSRFLFSLDSRFRGYDERGVVPRFPKNRDFVVTLLLFAPALLLLTGFLILPVIDLSLLSFTDSAGPLVFYERLVSVPGYLEVLIRTLMYGFGTALLSLLFGYPVAYALANARAPLVRGLITIAVLLPFWTNLLVRSFGWIIFLNPTGILNEALLWLGVIQQPLDLVYNAKGVLIGMTQIMLPFMILPLYAVMTRLDRSLPKAARSLGAGPITTFFKVYVPLTAPGAMGGLLLVFTISIGFYIIPALLGGAQGLVISQLIAFNIDTTLNWGMAAALSVTLLATTLIIFWIAVRWFNLGAIWGVEQ